MSETSFKTSRARLRFVDFLEDDDVKVSGVWTNSEIINLNNDKSSIALAKLEERWLKLDR